MIEDPKTAALLLSLVGTLFHLLASGVLLRISKQRFLLTIMTGLFAISTICVFGLYGPQISAFHFLAFFGLGCVLNLFLYGAVAKSLSLQMLSKIYATANNRMDRDTLDENVTMKAFNQRVELLVEKGWVSRAEDAYYILPEGNKKAKTIASVRQVFGVQNSGFYGD